MVYFPPGPHQHTHTKVPRFPFTSHPFINRWNEILYSLLDSVICDHSRPLQNILPLHAPGVMRLLLHWDRWFSIQNDGMFGNKIDCLVHSEILTIICYCFRTNYWVVVIIYLVLYGYSLMVFGLLISTMDTISPTQRRTSWTPSQACVPN